MSYVSHIDLIKPTPTPELKPVVRLNGVSLDSNRRVKEGSIFPNGKIPELIAQTDTLYTGAIVDGEGIREVVAFIIKLEELDLAVVQATIYNENYIELQLVDGVIVRYSHRSDPVESAYTIQKMYSVFLVEGDLPEIIDVRFQKPTIIN